MHLTVELSVDLALLTQALDHPETDIVTTLHLLAAEARRAVPSYLGMSLTTAGEAPFSFNALEEDPRPEDVRNSLLVPLGPGGPYDAAAAGSTLVLYAAQPGALVDLAADLSWLTGIALAKYSLDQHLSTIARTPDEGTVHATSTINQAIGVLIGRGYPPEQAHDKLASQAADVGTDRYTAAIHILRALPTEPDAPPYRDGHPELRPPTTPAGC